MKFLKKLGKKNSLMKPLSVLITSASPAAYLLSQASQLIKEPIDGELVAVSANLISGLQGSLILFIVMLSIIQTYKPSKVVIYSLIIGGLMIAASSLFLTLGITIALYGLGNLINKVTVDKLIIRNNKLKEISENKEIERLTKL